MTDFVRNISDAVEWDLGLLVSQVTPSHCAKSHYFFDAHGGIYSENAFPSPIICINPFSQVKTHLKWE